MSSLTGNREHRAKMIHQMELYLGFKEKCRRVQLLKHFDPGSTGDSLGIARAKGCCDCCTMHILRYTYRRWRKNFKSSYFKS